MATDAQLPHTPTTQQSPTLLPSKLHHNHEPLRSEMCRYFTLNLRADQARSAMHHGLQQNRYMHVFHGPPYERVEHWNRCLTAAKDDYDEAERRWRGILNGDEGKEGGEVDVVFLERVRGKADELEELLRGIGGVGRGN